MTSVFTIGLLLAVVFFVALWLRAWAKYNWFLAWLIGSMIAPAVIWISVEHKGLWVIVLYVIGAYGVGVAALGVLIGWLIVRKYEKDTAASGDG